MIFIPDPDLFRRQLDIGLQLSGIWHGKGFVGLCVLLAYAQREFEKEMLRIEVTYYRPRRFC